MSSSSPNLTESWDINDWFNSTQRGLCGLLNLGNTCFLNTAIQCLLHTPHFVHLFMSNRYCSARPRTKEQSHSSEHERWMNRWNELSRYMWNEGTSYENRRVISPVLFLQDTLHLARCLDMVEFSGFGQKDCVEFILFAIDRLHQSMSYETTMTIQGEPKTEIDKHAVDAYTSWIKFFQKEYSDILPIFYGQFFVKVVTYDANDEIKETTCLYEPFNSLAIDIPTIRHADTPDDMRIPTILDCLRYNFRKESIPYGTGGYKNKMTMLWKLPTILIVSLKRYQISDTPSKNNQLIDFTLSRDTHVAELDLSEFVVGYTPTSSRYRLYAVVHHVGDMDCGHYYASIRHTNGQWYCMDDTNVYPIDDTAVKRNVYALLYQHIV